MEEVPQERLIFANGCQLGDDAAVEFGRVSRGEVVKACLRVATISQFRTYAPATEVLQSGQDTTGSATMSGRYVNGSASRLFKLHRTRPNPGAPETPTSRNHHGGYWSGRSGLMEHRPGCNFSCTFVSIDSVIIRSAFPCSSWSKIAILSG